MIVKEIHQTRKRRLENRLRCAVRFNPTRTPVLSNSRIRYEMGDKARAINVGGIGLIHQIAIRSGLVDAINGRLHLLKMNFPYVESDHVLNIAYNAICGGTCLEDIELRRNDATYLDALGAQSIPDPTTAGDFCRRFDTPFKIAHLHDAIDEARLNVWQQQPDSFFEQATIDVDSHVLETTGSCKEGMEISYNGKWGYHPLIVSLANTQEILGLTNRPANMPSQYRSVGLIERAVGLCRRAGFRRILLRGDSKFAQTRHFDRWDDEGLIFHLGYEGKKNVLEMAENLPKSSWKRLSRPSKYEVKTRSRRRPRNVKDEIVCRREFENQVLQNEEVAEFEYRPTHCKKTYRMIAVRKNLGVVKGQQWLFDKSSYLLYITNDRKSSVPAIVFSCNGRGNQENLIEQAKNGVRALHAPVNTLLANWAYMVMTALAWNLKAWAALLLPENGRWATKRREEKQQVLFMDFRTFTNYFIQIPTQIIHRGRQLIYRLLNWNQWSPVFYRLATQLRC